MAKSPEWPGPFRQHGVELPSPPPLGSPFRMDRAAQRACLVVRFTIFRGDQVTVGGPEIRRERSKTERFRPLTSASRLVSANSPPNHPRCTL